MRTRLLFIITLVLCTGCSKEWTPPPARYVTLVVDRTNRHLAQTVAADAPEIIRSFGLETDLWQAVDFRIATLSRVAYNESTEITLQGEDPDDGNILVRKRKAKDFVEQAAELIRQCVAGAQDDSASVIYLPVALEFERLAKGKTCSREVIIYSDLVEHSITQGWSLYDDVLLDSLTRHPDVFVEHFTQVRKLPDLTGLKCTVLNIPRSAANSDRVTKVFNLWEYMLRGKGCELRIAGNYHCDAR